jgi:hypothetical protein
MFVGIGIFCKTINFTEKHVLLNRGRPPEDFPLPSLDWIVVSDIHFIFFKISEICLFSALIVETYNLSAKPIKYVIPFIKTELLLISNQKHFLCHTCILCPHVFFYFSDEEVCTWSLETHISIKVAGPRMFTTYAGYIPYVVYDFVWIL